MLIRCFYVLLGSTESTSYFAASGCEVLRWAYLYVCLSTRVSKTTCPSFTKFSVRVYSVALTRSYSHNSGIRYVLPVLWMTSCFHITGYMA